MSKLYIPVCAIIMAFAMPVGALDKPYLDRFRLWTECRPVFLTVIVSSKSSNLRLKKSRVETLARARLRSARIFSDGISMPPKAVGAYNYLEELRKKNLLTSDQEESVGKFLARMYNSMPFLYIRVVVAGTGFSVNIELQKSLYDKLSKQKFWATAWQTGSVGTYGNSGSSYILASISEHMDKFIDEYLQVNGKACKSVQ